MSVARKRSLESEADRRVRPRVVTFPDLETERLPCKRFLQIFYHVSLFLVSGKRSALGVARVRGSTRRGSVPTAVRTLKGRAMRELVDALAKGVGNCVGIPKDQATCRLLSYRFGVLEICSVALSPQIFAFLSASSLGGWSRREQQDIFCTFASCDPDAAFAVLRADWSLISGRSNHSVWSKYPGTRAVHRRICLAASQTWWHLATEASRVGRLLLLRAVLHAAADSVGYSSQRSGAWALKTLVGSVGDNAWLSEVADVACAGLGTADLRRCLLAAIEAASEASNYPAAAMAELRARLERLPPPRMPVQVLVERQLDLFGGVVAGDCPICFGPVTRENYYLTPCRCKLAYHSTCMARHAASKASPSVPCPTCRHVFPVVPV